jgi:hypothetical protein
MLGPRGEFAERYGHGQIKGAIRERKSQRVGNDERCVYVLCSDSKHGPVTVESNHPRPLSLEPAANAPGAAARIEDLQPAHRTHRVHERP